MLNITAQTSSEGAKKYFSQSDYYMADAQEIVGHWGGKGAVLLGLFGQVDKQSFDRLCDNLDPNSGEHLTAITRENRRVGYDFTFSVPKSVSLMHALTGDERVVTALRESIKDTMDEIEADMQCRVRKNGKDADRTTGNLVYSEFIHLTSRPVNGVPDPQLHAHVFTFNATYDPVENQWKAAQFGNIKANGYYWQAVQQARFANRLQELGYSVCKTKDAFEIKGVPESALPKFSLRTAVIENKAKELGITDPKIKAMLAASTRESKDHSFLYSELKELWGKRLTDEERGMLLDVAHGLEPRGGHSNNSAHVQFAAEHLFDRASVVDERRLLTLAMRHGIGEVTPEGVRAEVAKLGLLKREENGQVLVTTKELLAEENTMLRFAVSGKGSCKPLAEDPAAVRQSLERSKLSGEQRGAVEHLLSSSDRVMLLAGVAGSGKTTLTREAVEQIEAAGKAVVMLAPSAQASRGVLRDEGFDEADTLSRFLVDEQMQTNAKNGVIWVDEAGLIGTRSMGSLFDLAKKLNSRIILAGDKFQLASVERGSPLHVLEKFGGLRVAKVQDIRRQSGEYKEAVKLLSRGKAVQGIEKLDALGWIKTMEPDGYGAIAKDFVEKFKQTKEREKGVLIISSTHAEGAKITQAVRETMKADGLLESEEHEFTQLVPLQWTPAERADTSGYAGEEILQFHRNTGIFKAGQRIAANDALAAERFPKAENFAAYRESSIRLAKGDVIRISANGFTKDRKHKLNNGAVYSVDGFTKSGDIKLNNGWTVDRTFSHVAYAYASTGYAAQGRTVPHVIVVQSGVSHFAGGRENLYVAVSRGRQSATLYVDSKDELKQAAERERPRLSAIELMRRPKTKLWKRMRDVMAKTRTAGLLAAKAAIQQQTTMKQELVYGR